MPADLIAWDASLSQQPDHPVLLQRGCPIGYFAQIVPLDAPMAIPLHPDISGDTGIRCRLIATTTPGTLANESTSTYEAAVQVVADIAAQGWEGVQTALKGVAAAVAPIFSVGTGLLLAVGLVLFLWKWRR